MKPAVVVQIPPTVIPKSDEYISGNEASLVYNFMSGKVDSTVCYGFINWKSFYFSP
ncbi:hypothetical protein MTR_6g093190 [Medicago truncatula]|uniref:Uncharacterized protein n=1 Tax=Medicago truncatula TaxID=3880 RepID=A0A072UCX2_MEDTR|nr:hypothetical protein MTR_6g093190 [Medicago truncatula]